MWEIPSFHEWNVAERVERRWISLASGRNPRSSIRTSASSCFFRFNLKTKHVDFIHSFACQCHVYYTKYYNTTCNAVNTHLFKTALNPGADPGFQVRGGALKKIAPSGGRHEIFWGISCENHDFTAKNTIFFTCGGRRENFWGISCEKSRFYAKKSYFSNGGGRRENFWGISCEKSRFYAKKSYFFPILGGARAGCAPPPGSAPELS